jgi:hypothetical protein
VGAATVNAFGRGIPSLFADFGLMAFTTFHTHRLCAAVALRVVDPLAAMALRGRPRSAGPFNRDEEVANRLQLKNLISVLWYLDKYQGQGLFGPVWDHPGQLDRRQALLDQVQFDFVEFDLDGNRSQDGSEYFLLGESERVKRHSPLVQEVRPEIVGGHRIDPDAVHARLSLGEFDSRVHARWEPAPLCCIADDHQWCFFSVGGFSTATFLAGTDWEAVAWGAVRVAVLAFLGASSDGGSFSGSGVSAEVRRLTLTCLKMQARLIPPSWTPK